MKRFIRWVLSWAVTIALFLAVLYSFRLAVTDGPSMEPTITAGDFVFCMRSYGRQPEVKDIVLIQTDTVALLKRVAFLPGDTVVVGGQIYDYWGSDTVPEGYVFVMGDNYEESYDSRDPDFGLVPIENIWGFELFSLHRS